MNADAHLSIRVKVLIVLTTVSVVLVLLTGYSKYIYAEDYYFYVEAPCDSSTQTCFVRDCEDYCPPNELEEFKTYLIKAEHFSDCTSNSCINICEEDATKSLCEEVECNAEDGDDCST